MVPIIAGGARWIGGHYGDEFVEAHGKEMVVRSRLGIPLPSAGVGCALTRHTLALLAIERGGDPFRCNSLTEDYEVGMVIGAYGLRARFVDEIGTRGDRVVSRGAFPDRADAAVRQKARWVAGIALAGWDHLGWPGSRHGVEAAHLGRVWLARWMLWRDRRAPLAALVLLAAYAGLMVTALGWAGQALFGWDKAIVSEGMRLLLALNAMLLVWRLGMRSLFAGRCYGWREAVWAVPRAFVANVMAILAAQRALVIYWRMLRSGEVVWDKTEHRESDMAAEVAMARATAG